MSNIAEKKKLIYIGHSYHNKTQSTAFLKELLATEYEIEVFDFDPYNDNMDTHFDKLQGCEFELLVLFQIMPNMDMLKKRVKFKQAVFFPMFDGVPTIEDPIWQTYKECNIINFSKTLHERLLGLGLSSYYIQYFPKPQEDFELGSVKKIYFWQRLTCLNIGTVEKLTMNMDIEKIHIHKALDPCNDYIEPSAGIADKIEYSKWYENKKDMLVDVTSCALYIAPRLYEGIGMSFLEAMAMGRCVIAPNHPTMNEYIEHGKTGILYDFANPSAIDINNIAEIQKNTLAYIQSGYEQWEQQKHRILEWAECAPKISTTLCAPSRKRKYLKKDKYYLFACVHVLSVRYREHKTYYDIFDVIRVLKIERRDRKIKYYLLGFIPVWKVKYE